MTLITQLPQHYQISPQDAELQRVLGLLAGQLQADRELTLEQLYPSTASGWGLELWERAYGLPVAKLQGIAEAFSDSAVEILELFDQYRFEIWYTETIGPITHPEDLAAIVNELKPAHLEWAVKYRETCRSYAYAAFVSRSAEYFLLRQEPYHMPKWQVEAYVGALSRQSERIILKQS